MTHPLVCFACLLGLFSFLVSFLIMEFSHSQLLISAGIILFSVLVSFFYYYGNFKLSIIS